MNIIVSGGAGFIGSHAVKHLCSQGHDVIVVDNLLTGQACCLQPHPNLKILHKDIAACSVDDFISPSHPKIDAIVHLAAIPSVNQSWQQPQRVHDNNCSTILSVIELCKELKIPRLVFASSAAVYGEQHIMPISENSPKVPLSPYGLQKLTSERYAEMFAQQFGYSCVVLRFFNVYGPRLGLNSPNANVIDSFLGAFLDNLPIEIHGDGNQTRDFIHVTDVAESIRKAITVPLDIGAFEVCNIGSGKATSLNQLIEHFQTIFPDWDNQIVYKDSREGDIKDSQADVAKAQFSLNLRPSISLGRGLRELSLSKHPEESISYRELAEKVAI